MQYLLDTAAIFRFHKEQIKAFGRGSVESLGWSNTESQMKRFEVLASIANLDHHSILDAGCGHGDLCGFLKTKYPNARYFGVEQIPEILEIAIEKYSAYPDSLFFQGDFYTAELPATDYTLISGSLNYSNSDPLFLLRAIEKFFKISRKGFGFNLLSEIDPTQSLIRAYNPQFVLEFCRSLTPNVKYINDYLKNDFTIFMYHETIK